MLKIKGGGITKFFRLILSLLVMVVLGVGLFQAVKSFSGIDPLKISPGSSLKGLMSQDAAYQLATTLLTADPKTSLEKARELLKDGGSSASKSDSGQGRVTDSPLSFKFAVVTDSHTDNDNLRKALNMAKVMGAKFVVGLGDYTNVGTFEQLSDTKKEFDAVSLPYYVTAGDHDLWDSRNKHLNAADEFSQVFGNPYQSISFKNLRVILIYNSDNYLGLDGVQLKWIEDELEKAQIEGKLTLVFLSTPLYHPSSDHVMGKVNEKLKNQADHLISIIKKAGVSEVIAGDTHMYSRYSEPNLDLKMTTVGAVTSVKNPQTPRFVMVDVFQDGSYNIQDLEIK